MRQYGFSLTQENCRSGHIYWRNLNEKLHFLCSVTCRCRLNVIMTYGASFTKAWTRGRSRNWRCSIKKAGFKNFAIFLETPVLELCCKFMKKWFQHEFFLWILQKFLRTSTLKNICWRLLLQRATHLLFYVVFYNVQRQPSRGVLRKRCTEHMQQIYRRTPMPKCNFNKVAMQLYWNRTSA